MFHHRRKLASAASVVALAVATAGFVAPTAMAATQSGHKAGGATTAAGKGHRHDKGSGGQGPVKPVPNFRTPHNSHAAGVTSPAITRSEVIARAKGWVGKGLDYDWNGSYQGYRTDCSGYVSMAWNLSDSETTDTFIPNGVAEWISKDDLKPGDALLNDASGAHGHVVLFESWTSSAHDEYTGFEFTPSGVHHRTIPYPYSPGYGTFKPARLKNIQDDAVTPEIDRRDVATRIHGDFDGDGHDDVAAFYGYHDGSTALFTFKGDGKGGFSAPQKSWAVAPGQWTYDNAKFVAGDFNGDGRSDIAAFYGYANGSSAMFTFLSKADGGFSAPVKSWTAGPGQWVFDHVQLASGKFDKSGRDSVAALYGYSDGSAAAFTFKTNADGTFQAPAKSWNTGAGQWYGSSSQLVSGDFDGDGTTDLAAFYGYADGRAAMFTFKADGTGGFKAPVKSWNVPANNWWGNNVQVTSGDFNGDGRDDVAAVYSYSDGKVALFTFQANADGGFAAPVKSWNVPDGQWYTDHAQFVGGKFDASGRDSIAAFYGYSDGRAAMFDFPTDTKGNFGDPVRSWNVGPDQWWGDNVKLI